MTTNQLPRHGAEGGRRHPQPERRGTRRRRACGFVVVSWEMNEMIRVVRHEQERTNGNEMIALGAISAQLDLPPMTICWAITGGGREGEEQRKLHETARRADGGPGGGGGPPSTTTLAPTSTRPNGRCLEREPSHRPRRQHGMAWQLPACGRRREDRSSGVCFPPPTPDQPTRASGSACPGRPETRRRRSARPSRGQAAHWQNK